MSKIVILARLRQHQIVREKSIMLVKVLFPDQKVVAFPRIPFSQRDRIDHWANDDSCIVGSDPNGEI